MVARHGGVSHLFPGTLHKLCPGTSDTIHDGVVVQLSRARYGRLVGVLSVSGRAAVGSRLVGAVGSRQSDRGALLARCLEILSCRLRGTRGQLLRQNS